MGFYPPDALVHEAQRRGVRACARPTSTRSRVALPRRSDDGGGLHVRIGLGYVQGVREEEVRGAGGRARARAGPSATSPTSPRAPAPGAAALEQLAWAGALRRACRRGRPPRGAVAAGGRGAGRAGAAAGARQLALPLEPARAAGAAAAERLGVDAGRLPLTGVTLREHPLELLRAALPARAC